MRATYTQDILQGTVLGSQITADTRSGFVAGAGIEYGIAEYLSIRLEYDFLDFGTKTYPFNNIAGTAVGSPLPVAIRSDTHLFTLGINYRFNWGGGGPVVAARY